MVSVCVEELETLLKDLTQRQIVDLCKAFDRYLQNDTMSDTLALDTILTQMLTMDRFVALSMLELVSWRTCIGFYAYKMALSKTLQVVDAIESFHFSLRNENAATQLDGARALWAFLDGLCPHYNSKSGVCTLCGAEGV
jgi:hypothetical protein